MNFSGIFLTNLLLIIFKYSSLLFFSIDDKSTIMNSTKLFLDIKSINLLKKIIKHNREPHDCELYENLENKCEEFKNILNYKIDNINIDK